MNDDLISKPVKDNTEKENLINELLRGRNPSLFIDNRRWLMEIYDLLDKGFTTMVAIAAVYTVFQIGKIITKYIPSALDSFKEFISVWNKFNNAMEDNARAIKKNTEITDTNHKHSEIVLKELEEVNAKFSTHDENAIMIRNKVDELLEILQETNNSEESLLLLRRIINKLEE